MTDAPPTAPSTVAGRYEIGEPIGRGARAYVYEAVDRLLERPVAIKLFHASSVDIEELRAQEVEARLLGRLNHYALTTLFDAGIDESDPENPRFFLVMERIPGVDLKRWIRREGALTPAQVAYLGFDLAEGLQYVHEAGFLHRDIKPANVLIADRRSTTRIRGKLADFGIASIIGRLGSSGTADGTAAYLSPEQVDGQEPTQASDVYALGLVLLECLTGEPAFPGSKTETAAARLERDPHIPASVPGPSRELLRSMTALLPQDRPSLDEVALAFQTASLRDLVQTGRVDPATLSTEEERRMALVRRYNILDTPPDDAFDRISHLARRLLDVPIALVAILDADREWFKSRNGIEIEEIDRDVALCAITVQTNRPLAITDVQADETFRRNPIVAADPSLHAFLAVPLLTSGGHAIGTLCVFDRQVRVFTDQEIDDLSQLAAMAMRELDLRLASRRAVFDR
ncbi:protein kinase domain-containing protein [Amnibacterium setariae]|uniref:non-specific serine/threonine protein kinase n=1 Tax=Amnibacterium setariae TaxID=2306585 RepID=A0A3A1U1W9_9MICO|nr:protein kinase [Amnibacterium setariae]RIX30452.1 GAF domain-containing protein [Amnibacterium setariae]